MTSAVHYLENALVPQKARTVYVEGRSIQSLAPVDWQIPYVAFLDGQPILRADWELVLEDGQSLAFLDVGAIPQGGGGEGGSDPLRTMLMIAVMVYAPQMAGYVYGDGIMAAAALGSTGLAAFSAGAMLVGSALVNTLVPPPQPTSSQTAASIAAASPTYNIQAQGNTARLEGAIPEHFGRLQAYLDFAAKPYQEFVGNEQYVYNLL